MDISARASLLADRAGARPDHPTIGRLGALSPPIQCGLALPAGITGTTIETQASPSAHHVVALN